MYNFFLLALIFNLLSCSSLNLNSKKAQRDTYRNKIYWNQKKFSPSFFFQTYKVEEIFKDDLETQKKLESVNKYRRYSSYSSLASLSLMLAYTFTRSSKITINSNGTYHKENDMNWAIYSGLALTGLVPTIIFTRKSNNILDKAIDHYNNKMNLSIVPAFRKNQSDSRGQISLSFNF